MQGAGTDSDLIAGYARLAQRIQAAKPDVVMIFDSHWFTTGYHLVDGSARYTGTYISDEMPWYLHGVPYDYRGAPDLAVLMEAVSRERRGYVRAIRHPELGRHYATINMGVEKEIPDIFEFLLFGSGRLIFKPGMGQDQHKSLVVDNVFRVNRLEKKVREFLGVIKVDEDRFR